MSTHTVNQGECFTQIAERYGFRDYRTLYDHPDNAALKKARPNPNVLLPGDVVKIPDKDPKEAACATGKNHQFKVKRQTRALKLTLLDREGKPMKGAAYTLRVEGATFKGQTKGDGSLKHDVPLTASQGEILLEESGIRRPLRIGHLDPIESPTGVQGRLANLGYHPGQVDGDLGPWTEGALQGFQGDQGLPANGKCDDATRAKLKAIYGA
jgi:hypothetical protein